MKKLILLTIVVLFIFLGGFWTGRTQFQSNSNTYKEAAEESDIEKEMNELFPLYTVAGGLPKIDDKYRSLVDRWYGFRFRVNGSSCTDQNGNNVDVEQNRRTDSILTKRIGKDWMQKFEKTVDSLYVIDTLAVNIAKKDISVEKLIKAKSHNKFKEIYPHYKCLPTTKSHLKLISIQWEGKIYDKVADVSYIRVVVDLKENKVKKIEDTEINGNYFF